MQMIQQNQVSAVPNLVVLPQEEWQGIKEILHKVEDKLEAKAEDELNGQWLESSVARKMVGVSPRKWQAMRDERVIPFSQYGRKIYYRRADIQTFMEQHYITSN